MEVGARLGTVAAMRDTPFSAAYCEYSGAIKNAALTCTILSGAIDRNSAGVVRISYEMRTNGGVIGAVIRDAYSETIVTLLPDKRLAVRDSVNFGVPKSYSKLNLMAPPSLKSGILCKRVTLNEGAPSNLDELWISEAFGVVIVDFQASEAGVRIWHLESLKEGEPPPELFQIPEGYRVEEAED